MMDAEEYLTGSRLFLRLKNGAHGQLIERYAARLVEDGLARQSTWRCLNVVGDFLSWIASTRFELTSIDERMAERYLRRRGGKQSIQPGDRAALKRFLSVLRDAGMIASPVQPTLTPHDQIFEEFGDYLQRERGLTRRTIVSHLPAIRRFLYEVCPNGAGDLGKISQEDVIGYIERHARDRSPGSGKAMCWSLRSFLRYLHLKGLNPAALAGCVPSIRQWKLASLPTYLSAAQVQKVPIVVTGIRLSEAIGLERDDANLEAGVLTVRSAKFGKSRLISRARKTRVLDRDCARRQPLHIGRDEGTGSAGAEPRNCIDKEDDAPTANQLH